MEASTRHLFGLDQDSHLNPPIAYLRIYSAPSHRPQKQTQEVFRIGRVLVIERKRGLGIGRQIVQEAIAACAQIDPTRDLELSAQCYLSSFYKGLQFQSFGEPFDDAGIEHISMWRGPSYLDMSLSRRS
ncbi:MAG: GNAT family N-acetyltransferase, partial [Myxococcota bacterium]|nr:GNAT family N-acetyltransferase [Myxococcota bacterium]